MALDPAPTHPFSAGGRPRSRSGAANRAAPHRTAPTRTATCSPPSCTGRPPATRFAGSRGEVLAGGESSSCLFLQPARGRVDACGGRADSPGDGAGSAFNASTGLQAARPAGDGIVIVPDTRPGAGHPSGGPALRRGVLDQRSQARIRARRRGRRARSGSAPGSSAASARPVVDDAAASRPVPGGGEQLTTASSC